MPPSTRRSLRSRRPSPVPSGEEIETIASIGNDSILRPTSTSGSDGDQIEQTETGQGKKKSRSVTFSIDTQSPPSPSVSDESAKKKSARAQRQARRQAQSQPDPVKKGSSIKKGLGKKSFVSKMRVNVKNTKRNSSMSNNTTTIIKKGAGGKEEEVVKVKLNTGTLYLYKGFNRRAVFVRRL